jgi:hypothetical protein
VNVNPKVAAALVAGGLTLGVVGVNWASAQESPSTTQPPTTQPPATQAPDDNQSPTPDDGQNRDRHCDHDRGTDDGTSGGQSDSGQTSQTNL